MLQIAPTSYRNMSDRRAEHIVACTPVAKRRLLGNASKIHARDNRRTRLRNPFLNNGSVNTFPQQGTPSQQ
jgi:hypothetical protein